MNEYPQACREKYWNERTLEERVEQLADATESCLERINKLFNILGVLENHNHINGEVVSPVGKICDKVATPKMNPFNRGKK